MLFKFKFGSSQKAARDERISGRRCTDITYYVYFNTKRLKFEEGINKKKNASKTCGKGYVSNFSRVHLKTHSLVRVRRRNAPEKKNGNNFFENISSLKIRISGNRVYFTVYVLDEYDSFSCKLVYGRFSAPKCARSPCTFMHRNRVVTREMVENRRVSVNRPNRSYN